MKEEGLLQEAGLRKRVLEAKYKKLFEFIKNLNSAVVAFSGGVDSGLVTALAKEALGRKMVAVTFTSLLHPLWELREAREFAKRARIKHIIVKFSPLQESNFIKNTPQRCYYCKRILFSQLRELKERLKYAFILDGTSYEDRRYWRPGMKALGELGVISPLYECKFTKKEIRELARYLSLPFWKKPPQSCFATRIPLGEEITPSRLERVSRAEEILRNFLKGDFLLRARDHGDTLRLEFLPSQMSSLLRRKGWRKIIEKLKRFGYKYVVLDLEGYAWRLGR